MNKFTEKPFNEMDHKERLDFIAIQAQLDPESPLAYAWRTLEYERKAALRSENFRDRVALEVLGSVRHDGAMAHASSVERVSMCHAAYEWADDFLKVREETLKAKVLS